MMAKEIPSSTSLNTVVQEEKPVIYLSMKSLQLLNVWEEDSREDVPPPSPNSDFILEKTFHNLPNALSTLKLNQFQLPTIRCVGIKRSIEQLGEYFNCKDYRYNFLQYWFLDVCTDCLWQAQDRFKFPVKIQQAILAWMLFVFDLIKDPHRNFTRDQFFNVFNETILIAADALEEGGEEVLLPLTLVKIRTSSEVFEMEPSSAQSLKNSSTIIESPMTVEAESVNDETVLEFTLDNEKHRYVLEKESCYGGTTTTHTNSSDSLPSSYERKLEEESIKCDKTESEEKQSDFEEYKPEESYYSVSDKILDFHDFYKPDPTISSRFLPLSSSEELIESLKNNEIILEDLEQISKLKFLPIGNTLSNNDNNKTSTDKLTSYVIFHKESFQNVQSVSCIGAEEQSEAKTQMETQNEIQVELNDNDRIMEGLKKFKLMEQRVRDFNDSKVGLESWQMDDDNSSKVESSNREINEAVAEEEYGDENEFEGLYDPEVLNDLEEKEFLNTAVLYAIVDFVYEYFSNVFQYKLIKMALLVTPNLIIQKLNHKWRTPKDLKENLTVFVKDLKNKYKTIKIKRKKGKKPKTKKDKKSKKSDKTSKKSKKTKKKGKSDKRTKSGKSKKSSVKSKKSGKSSKASKKKKKPMTEEELLLQQQLAEIEAEKLRQEMNKKFLFPLQDAIDNNEFFMSKFPDWQEVDWRSKKGRRKGKRGDTKSETKSKKSSKQGKKKKKLKK